MSVRAVVETTLHESDLLPAFGAAQRMREGAAAHRARQQAEAERGASYRAETALRADYEADGFTLHVTGRADGVTTREDGLPLIEEIKLGDADAALMPAHRAQAAMYGHMLCLRDGLPRVALRVLYVSAQGEPLRAYEEEQSAEALLRGFNALCAPAAAWEKEKRARRIRRDASLAALPFPYPAYRAGQERFARNVYVAVSERRRLFAQAPTGIGKTVAALYPALLALREGRAERALFLTARTTGRQSALDAMARLSAAGARAMTVELTAKDKACPRPARDCRPEICPLARGFFDRLPGALREALAGDGPLDAAGIARLAEGHALCPFELSLSLAALADVVVCDYNYVFDPAVAIDALLPGSALLVDEAHQLPARVRDALSAEADEESLRALRREAGRELGRRSALYRALTAAISALREAAEAAPDAPPPALGAAMDALWQAAATARAQGGGACAADALALSGAYLLACTRFDERYAVLSGAQERRARVSLLCLDASGEILSYTKRARGAAFFSATLAPFDAARRMLGSEPGDACLSLPSPFDPRHLSARVADVDIRYAARERTAGEVARLIREHLAAHPGNALAFFPSYAYMERILSEVGTPEGVRVLREARGQSEAERAALLSALGEGGERAALFAVLGGAFSEAIDLPGARLESVIVVSTGLPQIDERQRAMRAYYDARGEDGYFLTMTLPGMVRVIQAAGRLIRTERDTGTLLLIDSRYRRAQERALLRGTLIGDALGIE